MPWCCLLVLGLLLDAEVYCSDIAGHTGRRIGSGTPQGTSAEPGNSTKLYPTGHVHYFPREIVSLIWGWGVAWGVSCSIGFFHMIEPKFSVSLIWCWRDSFNYLSFSTISSIYIYIIPYNPPYLPYLQPYLLVCRWPTGGPCTNASHFGQLRGSLLGLDSDLRNTGVRRPLGQPVGPGGRLNCDPTTRPYGTYGKLMFRIGRIGGSDKWWKLALKPKYGNLQWISALCHDLQYRPSKHGHWRWPIWRSPIHEKGDFLQMKFLHPSCRR